MQRYRLEGRPSAQRPDRRRPTTFWNCSVAKFPFSVSRAALFGAGGTQGAPNTTQSIKEESARRRIIASIRP